MAEQLAKHMETVDLVELKLKDRDLKKREIDDMLKDVTRSLEALKTLRDEEYQKGLALDAKIEAAKVHHAQMNKRVKRETDKISPQNYNLEEVLAQKLEEEENLRIMKISLQKEILEKMLEEHSRMLPGVVAEEVEALKKESETLRNSIADKLAILENARNQEVKVPDQNVLSLMTNGRIIREALRKELNTYEKRKRSLRADISILDMEIAKLERTLGSLLMD